MSQGPLTAKDFKRISRDIGENQPDDVVDFDGFVKMPLGAEAVLLMLFTSLHVQFDAARGFKTRGCASTRPGCRVELRQKDTCRLCGCGLPAFPHSAHILYHSP